MRQNLVSICPVCDLEMINMGNNDFRHFICVQCGKDMGRVCDSMITQKELDEYYNVERAKHIRKMGMGNR